MSVAPVREKLLSWVAEQPQGTVRVDVGSARQYVVRQVLPTLQEENDVGTPESLTATLSQMINRDQLFDNPDRRALRINAAGRQALNNYQSSSNGAPEAADDGDDAVGSNAPETADDTDATETPVDAPAPPGSAAWRERQVRIAEAMDRHAADDATSEQVEEADEGQAPEGASMDYAALATALLTAVIERATTESQAPDPAVAEEANRKIQQLTSWGDRLKAELADSQAAVQRVRGDRQRLEREGAAQDEKIRELTADLARSNAAHGQANEQIGKLQARIDALTAQQRRVRSSPAFSEEDQKKLAKLMTELPSGR